MSADNIKNALKKLRDQIDSSDSVDEETLALAQSLEVDIQRLLDTEENNPSSSPVDLANSLEARFESNHPVAAGIVREIVNTLQKMGV
ncbi:MAG: DUF4404 family protein [Agarilytica sp.]